MTKICLSIMLVFLTGCTMMPAYTRPQAPVPGAYPYGKTSGAGAAADIGWKEFFADARLKKLIELALVNNRDLRVAVLNVEQVRAQYRVIRFALLPTFEGEGDYTRKRDVTSSGSHTTTSDYKVMVDTAYEVDLFGRIRSLRRQVLEQYFGTEEARKSAQLALVAQVATQYLAQRAFQEQLDLSRETLKSAQSYYDLINSSYKLGNASALDLRSAQTQVETARANIAAYERQHAQAEDALVFLIGGPLPQDLPQPQPLHTQGIMAELPEGFPSDLIERRPDILQAEHALKAANANIGAVRAAFFPRVMLTAAGGTSSIKAADLFTPGSEAWSFGPQVTLPIFNQTNNLANLDAAHVGKKIQVALYEKAVQNAFREVSDALVARTTFNAQINAQRDLVTAQQERYTLADARYRNGIDNFLSVLLAQQDLYVAQQNLIQAEFERLANLITLYKALGGGWKE